MREIFKGFKEFILRGNVVDLAIAVVIGAAFTAVVNAFVKDILTPLIAAIFGKPDFSTLYFTIHKSKFLYGDLINVVIAFLAVAATIYFLIVVPLNRIAARRQRGVPGPDETPPPSEEAVLLAQIRDLLEAQRTSR